MALGLHNLQAPKGDANKSRRRVGRGNASGMGTYSGHGQKGQRSRTGGSGGLRLKALRKRVMSMPKLRGFNSMYPKAAVVNLDDLQNSFDAQAVISPKSLTKKGLVDSPRYGVKILGTGKLSKAFTVRNCQLSASAKEKIEKAGGKIVVDDAQQQMPSNKSRHGK